MSTTTSKGTGNTTEAGGMDYQPWKLRTKGELVYAKEVRPYPEIATVGRCGQFVFGIATPGYPGGDYRNVDCPDPCGEADAAFIVRAWNSHPSLLAELAALKASNAALVEALREEFAQYLEMLAREYPSAQSLGGTYLTVLLREKCSMLRDSRARGEP